MPPSAVPHISQAPVPKSRGLTASPLREKLRLSKNHLVIPSQCAHWRGNPVNRSITLENCQKSYGIATVGCAHLAMTPFFDTL